MDDTVIHTLQNALQIKNLQVKKHLHEMITDLQSPIDKVTTYIYKYLKDDIISYITDDIKVVIFPDLLLRATDIAPDYELSFNLTYYINLYVKSKNDIRPLCFYQDIDDALAIKIRQLEQKGISILTNSATDTKILVVLDATKKRNANKDD